MRILKYRAWDKHNQVMSYSDQFPTLSSFWEYVERVEAEVTQYIGQHDKNGIEIYESDAVSAGGLRCVVIWNDTHCRFELKRPGKQTIPQTISLDKMHQSQYEVVGNILENPLEVK